MHYWMVCSWHIMPLNINYQGLKLRQWFKYLIFGRCCIQKTKYNYRSKQFYEFHGYLFYKEIIQYFSYSLVRSILMQIKCTQGDYENTQKCISLVIHRRIHCKIDKWIGMYNFLHNEYNVNVGLQNENAFCTYYMSWHESKTLKSTALYILIIF